MSNSDLIQLGILVITSLVAIATLVSTIVTREMLKLSSKPFIKIRAVGIKIVPSIYSIDNHIDLKDTRVAIKIPIELSNIGSNPAQNICIDGEVFFKNTKPANYESLPIHLPIYLNILEKNNSNEAQMKVEVNFDNYIAKVILADYLKKQTDGIPYLPTQKELKSKRLWHSPKIVIKCYYTDIRNQNYCSELDLFFHAYTAKEEGKLETYLLNMFDFNYVRIRMITNSKRNKEIDSIRSKRLTSFDGELSLSKHLPIIKLENSGTNI